MRGYLIARSLILVVSFLAAYQSNDEGSVVEWRKRRNLSWDDFRMAAPAKHEKDAESSVSIGAWWRCQPGQPGKPDYEIKAFFKRDESWVKSNQKDDELLRHEQGHFDLGEIYARKLRRILNESTIRCGNNKKTETEFEKIRLANLNAMRDEQNNYDRETRHSRNLEKQKEWEDKIAEQLRSSAPPGKQFNPTPQ